MVIHSGIAAAESVLAAAMLDRNHSSAMSDLPDPSGPCRIRSSPRPRCWSRSGNMHPVGEGASYLGIGQAGAAASVHTAFVGDRLGPR